MKSGVLVDILVFEVIESLLEGGLAMLGNVLCCDGVEGLGFGGESGGVVLGVGF